MDNQKLFSYAKERGISEIEVYQVEHISSSISVFNNTVEDNKSHKTNVCYIRGAYKGKLGAIYLENNDLDIEKIVEVIKQNASLITNEDPYFIYEGSKDYPELPPLNDDFKKHSLKEKEDLILKLAEKILAADSKVMTCPGTSYHENYYTHKIENSNGLKISKSTGFAYIVGQVVVGEGDEVKSGADIQLAKQWSDFDLDKLTNTLVTETIKDLGGTPCASGDYQVLIKNTVMQSLLSAFSGIFSAEAAIQKMSFLVGKEETAVFGDNITIIDNPMCEFAPLVDAFDDEGVAAMKKTVIEKGVFKTFLHNLKTAKMMGTTTTGNGFKHSVSSGVTTRPSNLYIENGQYTFDELVKLCDNGIYLTDVTGLHAGINIISGDFSLQSNGFLIENGVITKPINLIVTSGNIKALLNNVIALGNDLDFKTENIASPSLLVRKLSISGK